MLVLLLGIGLGGLFALRSERFQRAFPWMPVPAWAAPQRLIDPSEFGPEFDGDLDVALDSDEEH